MYYINSWISPPYVIMQIFGMAPDFSMAESFGGNDSAIYHEP